MRPKAILEPFLIVKYAISDAITPPTSKAWGERFERAVKNDWPGVIRKAVAAGISPDMNNSVFDAVANDAKRSLMALIALKADPNGSWNYYSPLHKAVETENPRMVALLLDAKADPHVIYDETSPLRKAVWRGNTPIVRQLIDAGAPLNYQHTFYGNARSIDILQEARGKGYTDIVKMLEDEQQKRGSAPSSPVSPQPSATASPSAAQKLAAEVSKLSPEERNALFDQLARDFAESFANAGRVKVLKPLQFTRKPETQNQGGPA